MQNKKLTVLIGFLLVLALMLGGALVYILLKISAEENTETSTADKCEFQLCETGEYFDSSDCLCKDIPVEEETQDEEIEEEAIIEEETTGVVEVCDGSQRVSYTNTLHNYTLSYPCDWTLTEAEATEPCPVGVVGCGPYIETKGDLVTIQDEDFGVAQFTLHYTDSTMIPTKCSWGVMESDFYTQYTVEDIILDGQNMKYAYSQYGGDIYAGFDTLDVTNGILVCPIGTFRDGYRYYIRNGSMLGESGKTFDHVTFKGIVETIDFL